MPINIKRGLFRFWLVGSLVWIAGFGYGAYDSYREARNEWRPPSTETVLVPLDCAKTRGSEGRDFGRREGYCWYELPKFQVLYPEYKDLTADQLSNALSRVATVARFGQNTCQPGADREGLSILGLVPQKGQVFMSDIATCCSIILYSGSQRFPGPILSRYARVFGPMIPLAGEMPAFA
jgi:hypothetical protein